MRHTQGQSLSNGALLSSGLLFLVAQCVPHAIIRPLAGRRSAKRLSIVSVVLRARAAWRQVGHAGTLDPLATGLLIICVGKATKQINAYVAAEKEYTGARRQCTVSQQAGWHASLLVQSLQNLPHSARKALTMHCMLAGMHGRAVVVTAPSPGQVAGWEASA